MLQGDSANWKPTKSFHPKKIWFLPLHDAIWTNQGALRVAKRVMRQHWEKRIWEIPAWETKSFELIICNQNISMGFIKAGDSKRYSVIESRKHVTTGACTARRQDERKNS
tara:strand:- start:1078 stop:1407 length:330 start_codon:yes stop_codon:yes gene_type:complete